MFSTDTTTRTLQLVEEILDRVEGPPIELPKDDSDTQAQTLGLVEEFARRLDILPARPSSMATVTFSIGTASRDYSTQVAWEADLDNGALYSSGDDAVGECYNDSVFNEAVTINGGGTIGLNSVTLSVASGERHDGTAGTGARNETANFYPYYQTVDSTIEWLECVNTKSNGGTAFRIGAVNATIRNVIGRCTNTGSAVSGGVRVESSTANYDLLNALIYNCPKAGIAKKGAETAEILNSTFFNNGADGTYDGVELTTNTTVKNVISVDSTGDDFESAVTPSAESNNLSSDTTAGGTGSLTSKTSSNQFVSTVGGSEDLHLKTGADAIDAGTDLATTPTGVNIDIDGRDRDAEGDTWDMGAHEFVAAGGGGATPKGVFGMPMQGPFIRVIS